MSDALLSPQDIEEALSVAYVQAIAGRAGYVTTKKDFDRDGVDIAFEAGSHQRPKIDAQLKATINLGKARNGNFRYECNVKNYNLLVIATQTPRILIVLDLPRQEEEWLDVSTKRLVLKRCAYWISLKGRSATTNSNRITIDLPSANVFHVTALRDLMNRSRSGVI